MSRSSITIDDGIADGLPPIHPGEVLKDELESLALSANAFAAQLDVPTNRITSILNGRRGISADTALRLARFFGTTARFWLNLQASFDLKVAARDNGATIIARVQPHAA